VTWSLFVLMLTLLRAFALVVTLTTPCIAQDRTRVDLLTPDSQRAGHAIVHERTGTVELYGKHSERLGYGKIAPGGRVEVFDKNSQRLGVVTPRATGTPR
jgi:hypothetical protein